MNSSGPQQIVCPHCHTTNRVPAERLGDGPRCGACKSALFSGQPAALNGEAFAQHLKNSDLPLLVDFWAPWCGPCRMMAPQFEQAAKRLEPAIRLIKINTEEEVALATRFRIQSIPTLALFKNGQEVARQAGAMGAADIERWVRAHS